MSEEMGCRARYNAECRCGRQIQTSPVFEEAPPEVHVRCRGCGRVRIAEKTGTKPVGVFDS